MVTLRPMTEADVTGAVAASDTGFLAMRARYGLPVTANSPRTTGGGRTGPGIFSAPIPAAPGWPMTTA